jgi:type II secretory ATPase GspE/PulE/Tfp pilus assembly ATPase PilB-like protein
MPSEIETPIPRPTRGHLVPGLLEELHRGGEEPAGDRHGRYSLLGDVLLRDALAERATDVHLDPQSDGVRVRFRIDGRLHDVAALSRDHGIHLIRHFKAVSNLDPTNVLRLADARITLAVDGREIDLRLACAPTVAGEKLSIRVLDRGRVEQRLDQLGLHEAQHEQIRQWLAGASGMFLVAGPTGCGKTTTAYALLHEVKGHERSVVTIEDPVEYQVGGIAQMQVDPHRGLGFAEALRGVLRLDPDYVFVGEIRDASTADAAVDASAAGRVVMSTLHSPDAVGAVTTLRNLGVTDEGICSAVRMVVAQRLVRRLCPQCRRQDAPTDVDAQWLRALGVTEPVDKVWVPTGCDACRGIGYSGRVGIFEVWRLADADYSLLLAHASAPSLRQHLARTGVRTMLADGWAKAATGITSHAELRVLGSSVMNPAHDPGA